MSTTIRYTVPHIRRCAGRPTTQTWLLLLQQQQQQQPRNPTLASCRRFGASSNGDPIKPKADSKADREEPEDESHLNWKDRKEAPKWMQRIAPTKGGKWPPSPQEALILGTGLAVFVWSWTA